MELADDLRRRAQLVREHGWDPYCETWSNHEVIGVEALLDETAVDAALAVWAPMILGAADAEADAVRNYPETRMWFGRVARSAGAHLRAAIGSRDPDEGSAAAAETLQSLSTMDPETTSDKLHVPDDASEYEEALQKIRMRIPEAWGRWISLDRGWYPIIVELDERLAEIDPGYELHQVKEKFAELRYYFHTDREDLWDRMHALVLTAEERAACTCELCGQPGRMHRNKRGWYRTLCSSCADTAEGGYRPTEEGQ